MQDIEKYYTELFESKGYRLYAITKNDDCVVLNFGSSSDDKPFIFLDVNITNKTFRFKYTVSLFLLSSDYISDLDNEKRFEDIESRFKTECSRFVLNKTKIGGI